MKRVTWVLFAYFMVFFLILLMKDYPKTFFEDSGQGLPAPVAQFYSTAGCVFTGNTLALYGERFILIFVIQRIPEGREFGRFSLGVG